MIVESKYNIAGLLIGLNNIKNWDYIRSGRFHHFITDKPASIILKTSYRPKPEEPQFPPVFNNITNWRLFSINQKWIIWIHSLGVNPYLSGTFSNDFSRGFIYTSKSKREPGKYIFPLGYPMGKIFTMCLLGTGYGIMLHSCGLKVGPDGIAFAGVSSAGKSTTARLWSQQSDAEILNDDTNILRKVNGEFRIFGTPWHGEGGFCSPSDARLRAVFILKQATENKAVRLSPAQAAAKILVRTFAPLWSADGMNFILHFLEELCREVPCYELGFVPDQSAVDYVRCLSLK